jgi:hypothetical protein
MDLVILVELDDPLGDNDGSIDGAVYAPTEANCGVLVHPGIVSRNLSETWGRASVSSSKFVSVQDGKLPTGESTTAKRGPKTKGKKSSRWHKSKTLSKRAEALDERSSTPPPVRRRVEKGRKEKKLNRGQSNVSVDSYGGAWQVETELSPSCPGSRASWNSIESDAIPPSKGTLKLAMRKVSKSEQSNAEFDINGPSKFDSSVFQTADLRLPSIVSNSGGLARASIYDGFGAVARKPSTNGTTQITAQGSNLEFTRGKAAADNDEFGGFGTAGDPSTHAWYVFDMGKEECVELVAAARTGEFLVRTEEGQRHVLHVNDHGRCKAIDITIVGGAASTKCNCFGKTFPSLGSVLDFMQREPMLSVKGIPLLLACAASTEA